MVLFGNQGEISMRVICILAIALSLATCTTLAPTRSYSPAHGPVTLEGRVPSGENALAQPSQYEDPGRTAEYYPPRPIYDNSGSAEPSYSTSAQPQYTYSRPSYGTYSSGGGSGCSSGNYYGATSCVTGLPKTVHVRGYFRKNGTYVRPHYRSKR